MHKAEREHVLGGNGGESIDRFPQVTILCALASSKEALTLQPLRMQIDPEMVINVDAHVSALHVISKDSDSISPAAKNGYFELLVQISSSASKISSFRFSSQTAPPSKTLLESLDMNPNNITDPMCLLLRRGSGMIYLRRWKGNSANDGQAAGPSAISIVNSRLHYFNES
eukprot:scaffold10556_cov258-Chaetoceros_neogracile.AAC.60